MYSLFETKREKKLTSSNTPHPLLLDNDTHYEWQGMHYITK